MAIESIMQRFGRGPLSLLLDVVSDISTRKQLEKLRKEYIAMVSHELRSPLTSIAGWLTIMNEEFHTELPPRVVQIIHKVQRQSQHMLDLVDVILDIERLEAGQWPLDIEPVAISDVVAAAIETLQMVAAEVKVHIEFEPTDALAAADRARLLQVMINLLGNAIKFSPGGANITGSARAAPVSGWPYANKLSTDWAGPSVYTARKATVPPSGLKYQQRKLGAWLL